MRSSQACLPADGILSKLPPLDRLGGVLALIAAGSLVAQPFAVLKPNRIASGHGVGFLDALPQSAILPGLAVLIAAIVIAVIKTPPVYRFIAACLAIACLAWLIGLVAGHVAPPDNAFARVSPASGFWLLVFVFALLLTDAAAKMHFGPFARLGLLAAAAFALGLMLASGHWDGLSVMREYATRAGRFAQEGLQHVFLAFASLTAAIVAGLPLGITCHRHAGLRSAALPALSIIQTVPSIAMYGLMLLPLGLIASYWSFAEEIGIRGIGTAPALIALFLYSLLPVVANTAVGLDEVPRATVDAATGMGMTSRQRLFQVELPLALPVILTGIRIVLVQNIGLVAIAAWIGGGGFGTFIYQGITQTAQDLVLLGAIPTIALAFVAAILLDTAIEISRGRLA